MRTTLDIDDDVLAAAKERAKRQHRSAGSVLSELARIALTAGTSEAATKSGFGFRPLPPRGGIVTNALIDELIDESE